MAFPLCDTALSTVLWDELLEEDRIKELQELLDREASRKYWAQGSDERLHLFTPLSLSFVLPASELQGNSRHLPALHTSILRIGWISHRVTRVFPTCSGCPSSSMSHPLIRTRDRCRTNRFRVVRLQLGCCARTRGVTSTTTASDRSSSGEFASHT